MKRILPILLIMLILSFSIYAEKIVLWTWYEGVLGAILRDLINEEFTPQTGIEVEVLTVPIQDINSKLIMAHIGGDAPDIVELYSNQVVELGVRGALYNLMEIPDINSAIDQVYPQYLTQLSYRNALFGLPGENNWLMTYYREDIFNEHGLDAPETWDDVRDLSIKLLARDMGMYYNFVGDAITVNTNRLLPFLFQRDSDLYNLAGDGSNLDSKEAIAAFSEYCALYTDSKMRLEDPIETTFISGETPLLFAQSYRYSVFERIAPNLVGKWSIKELPGTPKRSGKIDHTNASTCLAWAMPASIKNKDAAFKLLKWLTSSETTGRFMLLANQSSEKWRLFFASKDTLDNALFPEGHLEVATRGLENSGVQRAVIGGYIADRYIDFAFNRVILQGEDPEVAIRDAAKESTMEIQKKLREFARFIDNL
ncbi:MAG: extracellular solute-binding protein [Firmicutes bacterium]|nr:extracellular solute-binding protein [Bacillota bacterium]MDD4262884.1 extracellular solute-binding protein [Bacillota bacterium]MDD4693496.1 extracellular solute-binding protein [Bacillota bacterium]